MDRRERVSAALAGEALDRLPLCLWRHWPGDDQRAADLVRCITLWQRDYEWDVCVVPPAPNFQLTGYGVQDSYEGDLLGGRTVTRQPIHRSLDWTELRPLDPNRGDLYRQTDALRLLTRALDLGALPTVQVIYSPFSQALEMVGREALLRQLRTHRDRVESGLAALAETTVRFIDAIRRLPLAGLYYVMDAAHELVSEAEYRACALSFDRQVLTALPTPWWLTIGRLRGGSAMVSIAHELPLRACNWTAHGRHHEPDKAASAFRGGLFGGLAPRAHLHDGTPATISDAVRQVVQQTDGRRLILGCDGPVMISTPLSNLCAVRDAFAQRAR